MPHLITLRTVAMGCDFEVFAFGEERGLLRSAAEAAVEEIERIEQLLSHYLPESEISYLNAHAAIEPVRVHPEVFALIERALRLSEETQGAFDITVMPLIQCWGFFAGVGQIPDAQTVAQAVERVGSSRLLLNTENLTVAFDREGVQVHLGAIGKGYAVDKAIEVLRDAGVEAAMVHGGHSSVRAYGTPPDTGGWQINLPHPLYPERSLAHLLLRNRAISTSSATEQYFERGGRRYGHILDPRTGLPVENNLLCVSVLADEAAVTDALSTAFFVLGERGVREYVASHAGVQVALLRQDGEQIEWIG
ncbi:MAG: FAD:protein FMN transferase [Armatimonadota bacterium]|nr:MAG: FAD:protein FMN transferase [Armatimonadota bacterium]